MPIKEMLENDDFYYNDQGYMVLTAKFLRDRGYCCGNGCRHCPYDYEKVGEPRRSQLIEQQKRNDEQKEK